MKYCRPGTIDDLFQLLQRTLRETFQHRGFGCFSITSQRSLSYTRQLVSLCDSTEYFFAFTIQEISLWKKGRTYRPDSLLPDAIANQPEQVLQCLEQRLLRTWSETGCGRLTITCDRSGRQTTRVLISGAPSFCFHLSDRDVQRWLEQEQAIAQLAYFPQ
ncbi:hypothetical protein ACQ4M4_04425 [Leptolyngbya sp. AN02str]|uniref:hypothetical protein n=1 Tax=Leptolyngbya sp. AN02str TaxID=3423363 RepID=UPI003D31B9EE